jgi:PilZ domain
MASPPKPRNYARAKSPKGLHVAWQKGAQRTVSRVNTISLGGLFILTPEPLAVGSNLQLLIAIPGGGVRALGSVRSVDPGKGMGVGIVSMSQDDRTRLAAFLKQLHS